jgi:hypothetical protein
VWVSLLDLSKQVALQEKRVFFTAGNSSGYRGNRCYRWGTVTVPSGSNRYEFSNLNLNSKNEKINKNLQKIVHDL